VVFLVGLYSNYTKNLTISASPGALTPTSASIVVSVGSNVSVTNISVLSVIYNPSLGQYLSNSGTVTYRAFSSQYYNLFNNFIPIYYALTGLNSFTLTAASLSAFQYDLEIVNSSILQASATSIYDLFGISYATIGAVTSTVCSPCNNYVYNGNCVNACPTATYPFVFADSGRACLACDAHVGQILNSLANGCDCLPGYQIIAANQCASTSSGSSSCSGVNVIQNGTTCICSPGTYNLSGSCGVCPNGQVYQGGTCIANASCPSNSYFNSTLGRCVCSSGYMNISSACVACQQGQYWDTLNNNCRCIGMNQ
jgi:hypothetical protein